MVHAHFKRLNPEQFRGLWGCAITAL